MKNIRLLLFLAVLSVGFVSCKDDDDDVLNGAVTPSSSNVEEVDLGLPSGTMWARCNLGASDSLGSGDYYAWGEIAPKKEYSLSNYLYYDESNSGYSDIGTNISATRYDVVKEKLGEKWCMPSATDFQELIDNCIWTWVEYENSVCGYEIKGTNGNKIFLPATGNYTEATINNLGTIGGYWSSNDCEEKRDGALALLFSNNNYSIDKFARYYGLAIRPIVYKKQGVSANDVDFTYEAINATTAEYKYDFYVISQIKFNNTSTKSGNVKWDFGAPQGVYTADLTDINYPIVKYSKPGCYDVTLTIEGVGSRTYPIIINDITPKISIIEQSKKFIEVNDCRVSFDISLPNPENKVIKYVWTFPEGTMVDGTEVYTKTYQTNPETGKAECPKNVTFKNLGSQKITVDAWYDVAGENRQLEQTSIDILVASQIEAPTLYYAQVGGNIKAMKLLTDEQLEQMENPKVYPYDMGVPAGENPFNLLYGETAAGEHWVYILDAGKQYYYINDKAGVLGDGKITAMRVDGTDVETVITNVGGPAYNDPYQGCIYEGYIYYNDRNRGFSKVGMTERGLVEGCNAARDRRDTYVVENELIPYYNRCGLSYGAHSTGIYRDKDNVWWWGKNYSGNGLYRFKDSDIYATAKEAAAAPVPYDIVLHGSHNTSFTIDEERNKLYMWETISSEGFYEYPLPKADENLGYFSDGKYNGYVKLYADPANETSDEGVYVKQMVVHAKDGKVYFGFCADAEDTSGIGTGLVYYDPETRTCRRYGETNDKILGVTINPNATKLF